MTLGNSVLKNKNLEVPNHIAFIMDGNGRWAKEKGKRRTAGHKEGSRTLRAICEACHEFGVKYVTVYAFSTENWKRPSDEVAYLMDLLRQYMKDSVKEAKKNNMRVRIIGDKSGLPKDIQESVVGLEAVSQENTGLNLQIALNYGSRNEITRALRAIAETVSNGERTLEEIDEALISGYLDTKDIPDPDLLIRPGGEVRLSNYLLWQLAYAEFYFTDVYWPDFSKEKLVEAIEFYNKIERRYGGIINED